MMCVCVCVCVCVCLVAGGGGERAEILHNICRAFVPALLTARLTARTFPFPSGNVLG